MTVWSGSTSIASTPTGRSRSTGKPGICSRHPGLGLDDIGDVWVSDPLFYPAKPPAHWLMVAEVSGRVLTVALAPSDTGDPSRCRPIGCYIAADHLARRYREDR